MIAKYQLGALALTQHVEAKSFCMSTDDPKVTIGWLIHNLPIVWWATILAILASVFVGGVTLSRTTLVSELLGKPSFKTPEQITEEVERRADQRAREQIDKAVAASNLQLKALEKEVSTGQALLTERERTITDLKQEVGKLQHEVESIKSDGLKQVTQSKARLEDARSLDEERQRETVALKRRIVELESSLASRDSTTTAHKGSTGGEERPTPLPTASASASGNAAAPDKRRSVQLGDLQVQVHSIKKLKRQDLEFTATLLNSGSKTLFVFAGDLSRGFYHQGKQGLGGTATDDVGNVYRFMSVHGFTEGRDTYFNDENLFMELAPSESSRATFILDDRSGRQRTGDTKVSLNIEFGIVTDLKAKGSLRTRSLVLRDEPFD